MSRPLILVRHAKTQPMAAGDRDRELTERGLRQAALLGQALAEVATGTVLGLVSAAVRAGQTWDGIAAGLDAPGVRSLESLYTAAPDDVLDEVRIAPADADTVIVVGHNPTIADLAWDLAGEEPGRPFDALRAGGYSPSTATVFDVTGEWSAVDTSAATLTRYIGPPA